MLKPYNWMDEARHVEGDVQADEADDEGKRRNQSRRRWLTSRIIPGRRRDGGGQQSVKCSTFEPLFPKSETRAGYVAPGISQVHRVRTKKPADGGQAGLVVGTRRSSAGGGNRLVIAGRQLSGSAPDRASSIRAMSSSFSAGHHHRRHGVYR